MEFADWFEGDYDNWRQASSYPTEFAHVLLTHTRLSETQFRVTQRYSHESTPYRDKLINIIEHDGYYIVENDICNLIFDKKVYAYRGVTIPGCIHNGDILISRVELTKTHYKVIDIGLDPKTNQQKWGSKYGPFIFDKCINTNTEKNNPNKNGI